ncbi:MAG: hypothetical protein K6348_01800 [Deferribacterales bacterium]
MRKNITYCIIASFLTTASSLLAQSTCTLDPVFVASPKYGESVAKPEISKNTHFFYKNCSSKEAFTTLN